MFSKADKQDFLANYWQQKPLFLPSFFRKFTDPIDPDSLAGLACEEFIESRLISNTISPDNWCVRHGPFVEDDFSHLPTSNWTLLVQAVDQWHSETASLLAYFDFIPNWRIDDIMVSFATDQAGVGPHYDYYDVFLVQGAGQRKWQLGGKCNANSKLRGDTDLRLLQQFNTEQEYILNPGDVLYIPPQYAHYGVSIGESLCYSIGFRSPSQAQQLQGFTDQIIDGLAEHQRFVDPNPHTGSVTGEILPSALDPAHAGLQQLVANKLGFLTWFGKHVTQSKYPDTLLPLDQTASSGLLESALVRNPGSRFAFMEVADQVLLFVDGECYSMPLARLMLVREFCATTLFSADALQRFTEHPDFYCVINELLSNGSLLQQQ